MTIKKVDKCEGIINQDIMLVLEHIYNACEDGDGKIFVLHGDGDGLQSTPLASILSDQPLSK